MDIVRCSPLGTSAGPDDSVLTDFDFFRLHHTAYYHLGRGFYTGAGLYYDNHINIGPDADDDDDAANAEWADVTVRAVQRSPRTPA